MGKGADCPPINFQTARTPARLTGTVEGAFASYRQWTYNTPFRGRSKNLFPSRRNGAIYQTAGQWRGRDLVTWDGSQECALAFFNVAQSGNDSQIEKMAALYGYPD